MDVDMNLEYSSSVDELFSYIDLLPSVSVSNILSFLNFQDKLNVVQVFPAWEEHLRTTEAWPELVYFDNRPTRIKDRQEVCQCLRMYGKYMKSIKLNFHYHVRTSGISLLKKIAAHCCQLQSIHLIETDFDADRPFKTVLDSCRDLKAISVIRPWVDRSRENNIVALITQSNHAYKITELVAVPETAYPEFDFGKALVPSHLVSLHTLKLKRSFLTENMLIELAGKNLRHLSVFQDEELPLDQPILYREETWEKVLATKRSFCYHVALRNIIMLRSCFPSQAPLTALILVDLLASLTKGILDTISEKYFSTLELFVCTKSYAYESVDVEDKRLPVALVDLANHCTRLNTLVYGFSISSATVLLLAKIRKFNCLDIPLDTLSYKCDWKTSHGLSISEIERLAVCGATLDRLEEEVSILQCREWVVSDEPRDRKIQHYFKYF